ncbi:hypothetical protein GCM10009577_52160 [Streptomyces javensis]
MELTPPTEVSTMASQSPERGRVYRRCGCRRPDGRQYGARCPKLHDGSRHGSWAFAVDLPSADDKRHPLCRSGSATQKAAETALERALESERTGLDCSEDLTIATYLAEWVRLKEKALKPTTYARYRDHVHADLIPSFGRLPLTDLRARHITAWSEAELARGRGRTAVYRIGATFSSALSHAVRTRVIAANPCRYVLLPRPVAPERICWNPAQAAAFLRHNHAHYGDQMADLFELLLGTGMRRGESLGLHWTDVHLAERMLLVRWSLTAVNNNHLYLDHPKTKASRNWVSLAPRVVAALERQAALARAGQPRGRRWKGWSSAVRTGRRCVRRGCWWSCGGAPPSSACHGSACTTCGTPPPPS